ncbi:MAG: ABC transporter ATP-binding protein [Christensenellales bacterium]
MIVIAMPMIEVKDVKKVYKIGTNALNAVDGVSFSIEEGEFCCIVGRSGSGKSTLLNLMAGLEPVTSGQIIIAGKHVEKMTESELIVFRQKNIGFVFQSFNLIASMTALENTALPLTFRGLGKRAREKKAKEMLEAVGLGTHAKHKPSQMSGGQQQRTGLARALVLDPKIIFADEPTGNLDSKTSEEMMELITGLMKKRRQTFIMVTHDPSMAAYADKVINMLDGRIVSMTVNERRAPQDHPVEPETQSM